MCYDRHRLEDTMPVFSSVPWQPEFGLYLELEYFADVPMWSDHRAEFGLYLELEFELYCQG